MERCVYNRKDLEGAIIAESPQQCVSQLGKFQERALDEIVFDLTNTFDEWGKSLELLATSVLPHFKESVRWLPFHLGALFVGLKGGLFGSESSEYYE